MLKRKLHYCVRKAELDLEFLFLCRDSNTIPNIWNFYTSNQSFKVSLTYKQCQIKSLENIRHKKPYMTVLNKELNPSLFSLQHEIDFINFSQVKSLFIWSNNKILASKSSMQQKKVK